MLKPVLKWFVNRLFRVTCHGHATASPNGRTLVVANHESFLDGLVLGLNLPFDATFAVHTEIAHHWLFRHLLKFVDHLAIDPTNPLALKKLIRLVESGRPVVIFPEGRITLTGALMKVYDGAGFIAAKTGAEVVPIRLEGPVRSLFSRVAGLYPRRLFPRITLSITPSRRIPLATEGSAKQKRRQAGEAMRHILLDLLVRTSPRQTLFEAFLDAKDKFGSNYQVVEDQRLVKESYGDVTRMVLGMQHLLEPRTHVDERVGVLLPTATPTLAVLLALTSLRRVPAMLNYTAGKEGLRAACVAACLNRIITSRRFLEKGKLEPLLADLPGVEVLYLEDLRAGLRWRDKLAVALRLPFARHTQVAASPDDPAVVLFTSGSEGKPKGVVHSHASLLANMAQVRAVADFTPRDKFMATLPLFHSFGLTCGALLPLLSGFPVFLFPSPLRYREIPETIYDRRCTVLFGTNTFLANYAKHAHPYDFEHLRYVVAGAEKLSDSVRAVWSEKFGLRIMEGYGVTECAPVIAVNTPMAAKRGTVGQLVPGLEYRLDPVPGLDHGGVLSVRGPNLMLGYLRYEQPGVLEVPTDAAGERWYTTGDVVSLDAEGYLRIEGRIKRFSKIGGEMVSHEVAERLAVVASPEGQHAVSARADASKGEALVLFTTDGALTRDKLVAAARQTGSPELAVPRQIKVVKELPLLGTGKRDYVSLKQMAEAA